MKYYGCAYYPEYWGVDRVAVDAKLMRAAGINLARIGEFAWSRMEPEEGQYDLTWLHRTAEILAQHDIQILMCTPTAAPPAWLTEAYPDVCVVRSDGFRLRHGARRHYCPSSETYRTHSARITEVLAREMSRHTNVTSWQLDNEFGPEAGGCYCAHCQARFRQWLKARYGSVAGLNTAWGTGFWSHDYTHWDQVRLADEQQEPYSSRKLDSRRFHSTMFVEFARQQTEIIRRNHPGVCVTTNGMGPVFPAIDYYQLFGFLDVACDDLYFDIATMDCDVAAFNWFRNLKPDRPFWITETGSGALDHNKPPYQDQFRAWAWSGLAHGAEAWLVFRWRTCLSGHEQELQGILEHSGKPRHRYEAVKNCFLEMQKTTAALGPLPAPVARAAVVVDYDNIWGYDASRMGKPADFYGHLYRLHKLFYARSIAVDLVSPELPLDKYSLVVLPSLMIISAEFAKRLKAFAKAGGTVLATGQLGMRDANDNYLAQPGPQHLGDLFGVSLEGGMYLKSFVGPDEALWVPAAHSTDVRVPLAGKLGKTAVTGSAGRWLADLELKGATALLTCAGDTYEGQPAVTEKAAGKGRALYLATLDPDQALLDAVFEYALAAAGIAAGPAAPLHVEVVRRGDVTFFINHRNEAVEMATDVKGKAVLGTLRGGRVKLAPFGVCVVKGG